jgi:methylmalonyl-CoA/ethylmalonyl-CoA epimerase
MTIQETIAGLELAQIGWVVPDISKATKFLSVSLRVNGFPPPMRVSASELSMTYYGGYEHGDWLTTQAYNGNVFIELVQPLSGKSMFHDYLVRQPDGGVQHLAFRLPVNGFDEVIQGLCHQGYAMISDVDHPIARMAFFDTYKETGVATEIMGVTQEGWAAIEKMKHPG